jgi:hypothetical protein
MCPLRYAGLVNRRIQIQAPPEHKHETLLEATKAKKKKKKEGGGLRAWLKW